MEASATPPPPPAASYPARADAQRQERYNRWLPLIKWLLALPHYVCLVALFIAVFFAKIGAFFAVLFTGRYPRGIFDFVVGAFRWSWRVNAYVYLLRDEYPPFTLAEDPAYPAALEIDYPEDGIDNWRPLVQWLLVLPYLIVAYLLGVVSRVVAFIGIFVILFTEELPEGMFNLILVPSRWGVRAGAYAMFMVDRYPPFDFEELSDPSRPIP
jgi:uncharacterized protein DUF4389